MFQGKQNSKNNECCGAFDQLYAYRVTRGVAVENTSPIFVNSVSFFKRSQNKITSNIYF